MNTRRSRAIAAALLLVAIGLPFSTGGLFSFMSKNVPTHYSIDLLDEEFPFGILAIPAFTWPVVLLMIRRRHPARRLLAVTILEPLLAIGSAGLLCLHVYFQQPAVGWYVAQAGNALYLLTWLYEQGRRLPLRRLRGGACLA